MGNKTIKKTSDKVISLGLKKSSLTQFQAHNSNRMKDTRLFGLISLMYRDSKKIKDAKPM
jgi:hypothetical protein